MLYSVPCCGLLLFSHHVSPSSVPQWTLFPLSHPHIAFWVQTAIFGHLETTQTWMRSTTYWFISEKDLTQEGMLLRSESERILGQCVFACVCNARRTAGDAFSSELLWLCLSSCSETKSCNAKSSSLLLVCLIYNVSFLVLELLIGPELITERNLLRRRQKCDTRARERAVCHISLTMSGSSVVVDFEVHCWVVSHSDCFTSPLLFPHCVS